MTQTRWVEELDTPIGPVVEGGHERRDAGRTGAAAGRVARATARAAQSDAGLGVRAVAQVWAPGVWLCGGRAQAPDAAIDGDAGGADADAGRAGGRGGAGTGADRRLRGVVGDRERADGGQPGVVAGRPPRGPAAAGGAARGPGVLPCGGGGG